MVLGSFFLIYDENNALVENAKLLDKEITGVDLSIDENTILKLRMGHAEKQYLMTIFPDYQIYSFRTQLKKRKKQAYMLFAGVFLSKEENSTPVQDPLTMYAKKILEDIGNDVVKVGKVSESIEAYYKEFFDQPFIIFNKDDIEKRLSQRVKELNKTGEFDKANLLLKKMQKIPKKLYKAHVTAEKQLEKKQFEEARETYKQAITYAKSLGEFDLANMYRQKIKLTKEMPELIAKRDEIINTAKESLRSDNIKNAADNFVQAAEISRKLMDSHHTEEYSLKAKALAEYAQIEEKFK